LAAPRRGGARSSSTRLQRALLPARRRDCATRMPRRRACSPPRVHESRRRCVERLHAAFQVYRWPPSQRRSRGGFARCSSRTAGTSIVASPGSSSGRARLRCAGAARQRPRLRVRRRSKSERHRTSRDCSESAGGKAGWSRQGKSGTTALMAAPAHWPRVAPQRHRPTGSPGHAWVMKAATARSCGSVAVGATTPRPCLPSSELTCNQTVAERYVLVCTGHALRGFHASPWQLHLRQRQLNEPIGRIARTNWIDAFTDSRIDLVDGRIESVVNQYEGELCQPKRSAR